MTDFHLARRRMVEDQLVARGVRDPEVLRAMGRIPRHRFVEPALQASAYGDSALPIGLGQTISQPYMVALMTEALGLTGEERVLEIGTGSGYQTAVLAEIADRVFSVERLPALSRRARAVLDSLGYRSVVLLVGDGSPGWPAYAPYDAIIVTAGGPQVPPHLVAQLAEGGRLVIPVGERFSQSLVRVTRRAAGDRVEDLGGAVFVSLIGQEGWRDEGSG
jgi:protein-L-isoaspartate(D-aspartate) O-methyltransferase